MRFIFDLCERELIRRTRGRIVEIPFMWREGARSEI